MEGLVPVAVAGRQRSRLIVRVFHFFSLPAIEFLVAHRVDQHLLVARGSHDVTSFSELLQTNTTPIAHSNHQRDNICRGRVSAFEIAKNFQKNRKNYIKDLREHD